jgi:hypothetical protein
VLPQGFRNAPALFQQLTSALAQEIFFTVSASLSTVLTSAKSLPQENRECELVLSIEIFISTIQVVIKENPARTRSVNARLRSLRNQ